MKMMLADLMEAETEDERLGWEPELTAQQMCAEMEADRAAEDIAKAAS